MRRSFLLTLALLATVALASCGGGGDTPTPGAAADSWDAGRWDQATWQ